VETGEIRRTSRRLRDLVEPIAANVYFCPEAQAAYQAFDLGYIPSYFCSRGACMGQVPGEVIVSAFGVFNPEIVIPAVDEGWSKATATDLLEARRSGATAALARIFADDAPDADVARATELLRRAGDAATGEGRPLYSGLRSLGWPGDPVGDLWRAADLVREHRGDSHTAAWVSAGIDATEITLLTELWWRMPMNTYVQTRGWTSEQIDAAVGRLRDRGLIDDEGFTAAGEELRGQIEEATDRGEARIVEALGDDADELFGLLEPWATAVVDSGGYPANPADLTRR
jgi:hypothetical protein